MIEILLLEDNDWVREILIKILLDMPEVRKVFDTSEGKEAIHLANQNAPDLILIDIDLKNQEINGLLVAQEIYKFNKQIFIVFITAYKEFAVDSFSVHPYACLVKPFNLDLLKKLVKNISIEILKARSDSLVLKKREGMMHFPFSNILFIEKVKGNSVVHTYQGEYIFHKTLKELEMLLGPDFIRVHRGFIINKNQIFVIKAINRRIYAIEFCDYLKAIDVLLHD